MSEAPDRAVTRRDNIPPLDPPETLGARLEREHAALIGEAAQLEAESFALPDSPANDTEAGTVQDHVVKVMGVAKRLEDARTSEGRPYLEGTRIINTTFNDVRERLVDKKTGLAARLTERVRVYNLAKAERERAERLEKERLEREKAEAARREEERKRQEAEKAQREADEAAARIRAAKDKDARAAAEKEMRERTAAAAQLRKDSEASASEAATAERRADANQRAAEGDTGKLSKVSSGGSTSSVTKRWTYRIDSMAVLRKSLGPLEAYLTEDTIVAAVARAVREQSAGGATPTLKLPGVEFFQVEATNIRAAR